MNTIIKQRLKYIVSDFLAANIVLVLFNIFRYYSLRNWHLGYTELDSFLLSDNLLIEQGCFPFIFLCVYYLSGYYNNPFHKSRLQEVFTTMLSASLNSLMIYFLLLTNDQVTLRSINFGMLATSFGLLFFVTYFGRVSITMSAFRSIKNNRLKFNTLIIGNSQKAHDIGDRLMNLKTKLGYNIIGYVPLISEHTNDETYKDSKYRTFDLKKIAEICRQNDIKSIIIVPIKNNDEIILDILNKLFPLNIPIRILPDTLSLITSRIRLQNILDEPFIDLTNADMNESTKNLKRLIDVLVSAVALILLIIPFVVVSILINIDSKGGAIYKQQRLGYHQRPFYIYKFRTMHSDAEKYGPRLSSTNDTRTTKIGRILRKYRIDELPQFWNVLIGDMSLVGPRPERAFFVEQILKKAPYYSLVYQVRPGITSWGMIKFGYAKNIDEMIARLKYDLVYLENISILIDVKIIIYTIKPIFMGRGM